ncbi:hypothetical protein FGG08_003454 [Glutinoglossum americanum]|uniref:SP-RING-type domain-containing protein n=1 Tax=Glutinoglossum americanum TaxID=1670608 RepID=A0A9P8L0M8_9PEZI|nr:hypothetical protein FGG08_003454 [Glutinoglossum americanum]
MIGRDSADGGGGLVEEVERGGAVGGGGRGGGGDALQSPRRKSMAKSKVNPAAAAAMQFASSNTAVNTFTGGKLKSWMTLSGDSNASPVVNKQSGQGRPLLRRNTSGLDQSVSPYPSLSAFPNVGTTTSQRTSIPSPASGRPPASSSPTATIHSISDPSSHPPGPLVAGNSPAIQSTRRPDIQPPSNSTSPLLANTVGIQKNSGSSGSSGNKQTLPSPTPSDDAVQEVRQGNHHAGSGHGSGEHQSGVLGAGDSSLPQTQGLPQDQVNAQQSPIPMDTQPHPELSEKLNELVKQFGAKNVNNHLRFSDSARASPSEGNPGVSSGRSSIPSKRPPDGPLERRQMGSRPHSPITQLAQNPASSVADKRIRTQTDPSTSSLPSPRHSMTDSPGLAQGQFQFQPHGQVQGQVPSQGSNQAPTQVLNHAPSHTPNHAPTQVSNRVNTHATVPHRNGPSGVGPSPQGTQAPFTQSQRRASATTTTSPLHQGYGLQEKRNQLICGTVPNRRQSASQHPNRPTLSKFLPIIDRELRSNMEPNTELPRMRLLREACQEEDWFYVALHQMYCLFTIQQQALAGMVGSQKHMDGFQVVRELIKENSLLPKERLTWFAQFPSPLQDLYARSDLYRHAVGLVKDFLAVLPEAYARFQSDCRTRRTPPLVHELVIVMKLQSLIFQRVVYIAIRRGMWGPTEDEYTRRMHEVFQENQKEYLAILDRQDTAQPATLQSIVHAHQRIALEYNNIRTLQLEYYGMNSPTRQNSLAHAQQMFRSYLASQPPVSSPSQQNGPQDPNSQQVSSTATANVFPNQPPAQNNNPSNTSQNSIVRNLPRQLSVNTQVAQQHLPPSLPSATRSIYASPVQTPSAGSPTTPGITAQMQLMQMQRLRQQQETLDRQRRVSQMGQQHQNTRPVAPGQIGSQAVPSRSATIPLPNSSSALGTGPRFLDRRRIVAAVPAGAPDPRHTPTLSSFLSGGMSGSPRQHPINYGRPAHNRARSSQGAGQIQAPLLPPSNFTPNTIPGLPNPTYTALHQAHIRSPYLKCATPPPMDEQAKLYQYVKDFPLQPTIFPQDRPLLSYRFDLSITDSEHIANYEVGTPYDKRDLRRIRVVGPGSLMYRIRCVKLPSAKLLNEDKWVTTETKWPDHIFIDINQVKMETRRRLHFGKDLPIDITDHVRAGENNLKVSILRSQREINAHYAISVEVIEVTTHTDILRLANENLIPAQQSLNAITTSLNAIPDDDDIAVVNNDLTINISDPFTARVFNVPARGRFCLHRECFDLETFLATRASKPKRTNEPCMVDEWKCPLCAGDTRPHRLLVDGFLADVKRELDLQRLDEIRAIVVDKGGSWVPKIELADEDVKREASTASTAAAAATATSAAAGEGGLTPAKEKVIVIIDLDDD